MEADPPLPPFTYHGYLPEGVHATDFEQLRARFVFTPARQVLWVRFQSFLEWASSTEQFSAIYIDGGFITNKPHPEDIDVILETKVAYSTAAFTAMEPFFVTGIDKIYET